MKKPKKPMRMTYEEMKMWNASLRRDFSRLARAIRLARGHENWPEFEGQFVDFLCGEIERLASRSRKS